MRVNCYNASSCVLSDLTAGDTFYFEDKLFIKVAVGTVDVVAEYPGRTYIVALDTGELRSVKSDISVVLALTEVVARNAN